MKLLHFNGYFELPPDFEGGLAEALRAVADYIDATKTRAERFQQGVRLPGYPPQGAIYESFITHLAEAAVSDGEVGGKLFAVSFVGDKDVAPGGAGTWTPEFKKEVE